MSDDTGGSGDVGGVGGVGDSNDAGGVGGSGGVEAGDTASESSMGASGSEPSESDKNDFGEAMGGFGGLGIGNPGSYGGSQSVGAPGFDNGYSSSSKNEESSLNDVFSGGPLKANAPKDIMDEKLEQMGKELEKGAELAKEAEKHGSITQGHRKGSIEDKVAEEVKQAYDLINNPQPNARVDAAMGYLNDIVGRLTRTDVVFKGAETIGELVDSVRDQVNDYREQVEDEKAAR